MDPHHPMMQALQQLSGDIRKFIELSLREPDESWEEWAQVAGKTASVRCWERKKCDKKDCPAYELEHGRCWLTAGTMCGGSVQGVFAQKYKDCALCDVYQDAVFTDPVTEINEHLITLVHSLRTTQQKLMTLATRDALTGMYNRNFFNEIIMNEIQRTRRYGKTFSIVMLDIDDFKHINDQHGHLQGDRILKECAAVLARCTRSSDLVVRFGGDEFLIVTPGSDDHACALMIGRIEEGIEDWNTRNAAADFRMSVSVGCAVFAEGSDIMEVIHSADNRMYESKQRRAQHLAGSAGDEQA